MELQLTPTYITTVNADHTVVLPVDVPVGARVAIVLIPSTADEVARQARFAATLAAIREAAAHTTRYETNAGLDTLIDQARKPIWSNEGSPEEIDPHVAKLFSNEESLEET